MKYLLISVLIVIFCNANPGKTLKCYQCNQIEKQCKTNVTCPANQDSCIFLHLGEGKRVWDCFSYANCNHDYIEREFKNDNFEFRCCKKDFCNSSPNMASSVILPILVSVFTITKMLCF